MSDNNRGEKKITDELLKTHHLVRKVLEGFDPASERFHPITETLHRTVLAHAYLQDKVLLPALENKTLIQKSLLSEIVQEHKDLDRLLKALPADALQIRNVLEAHFKKEADTLYPLVEQVLDAQTLHKLTEEMERRQLEVRDLSHVSP